MGPQLVPQTPRNWSNLGSTRESNRPPNTLTLRNLDCLRATLRICCYRVLIRRSWVRDPPGSLAGSPVSRGLPAFWCRWPRGEKGPMVPQVVPKNSGCLAGAQRILGSTGGGE